MLLSKQIESGNFETQKPQISIILKINYVTSHEKKNHSVHVHLHCNVTFNF